MSHNGSSETSSFVDECWAAWFCNLSGNHFFCEIDRAYIEDSFNLFGLKQHLPKDYAKALDTILDRLAPTEAETEELSRSAALLYGLIHARYIITSHGLESMHRKYVQKGFGECPRMLCRGQPVLPMGFTDDPKHGMVKLFCPKCQDVYSCVPNQRHIDGAFFGPTFPNLFFMTYEDDVPEPVAEQYVPRVFGFRIHHSSNSLPRAGSGGRDTLSLYSGYAGRPAGPAGTGPYSLIAAGLVGMNAQGASHFGGSGSGSNPHALTQGNLIANGNNNGNHTSTSISESQNDKGKSAIGNKRRNNSASEGHMSTASQKGREKGAVSSSMLLQGNDLYQASLQIPSSSQQQPHTSTYTGLDGKIVTDIIDHTLERTAVVSSGSTGLGLGAYKVSSVNIPEREKGKETTIGNKRVSQRSTTTPQGEGMNSKLEPISRSEDQGDQEEAPPKRVKK